MKILLPHRLSFLLAFLLISAAHASQHTFSVRGAQALFDGRPFKVIGARVSNALVSDAATRQLIDNLDAFKSFGVNTVSVYLMGSRFGDVKGYRPDASLDPLYAARLARILDAADSRGMIVLVGCLYWSDSRAREDLEKTWTQDHANRAVANTVAWLKSRGSRNVFVDPDNEGMAHRAAKFDIAQMIDAAHAIDPSFMIAWNDRSAPPASADLLIHHSPKVKGHVWIQTEGTPNNAPGGYWGDYSKRKGLYDYINIGIYTAAMKQDNLRQTDDAIRNWNGYSLASTWLQAPPPAGPHQTPGGLGSPADPGVRWWLEHIRQTYGPWPPPPTPSPSPNTQHTTHNIQ